MNKIIFLVGVGLGLLNSFALGDGEIKNPKSVAILGDSISVGSMTAKELMWDLLSVDKLLAGPPLAPQLGEYANDFAKIVVNEDGKTIPAPKRLWEKIEEFKKPPFLKETELKLRVKYMGGYLDIEEYSWGYLLARAMKVSGENIYMPGLAGNRASDTLMQVKRVLKNTNAVIPEHVYLFMTGNDLCSNNLGGNFDDDGKNYANHFINGLTHLLENGKVEDGKTVKVFVVSHLPIVGLIDNKEILKKKVYAFGKQQTCGEFRAFTPDPEDTQKVELKTDEAKALMAIYGQGGKGLPSVSVMCRSVLSPTKDADDLKARKEKVEGLTKAYQKYAEKTVAAMNELQGQKFKDKKISFHVLKSPVDFKVEAEDVANDCFHLSLRGQEKFARTLAQELKAGKFAETDLKP